MSRGGVEGVGYPQFAQFAPPLTPPPLTTHPQVFQWVSGNDAPIIWLEYLDAFFGPMQGFLNAAVYSMNRKLRQRYWSCLCGDRDLEGGGNGKVDFVGGGNERTLSTLPGDRLVDAGDGVGAGTGSGRLASPASSLSSAASPLGSGGAISVDKAGAFERMRALLSGLPTLRRTLSEGKLSAWNKGSAPLLGGGFDQCEFETRCNETGWDTTKRSTPGRRTRPPPQHLTPPPHPTTEKLQTEALAQQERR